MLRRQTQKNRHITSFQIIISGFFSIIMLGSLLLMLPCATYDGQGAAFLDALFTSTSAVCVTGLIVRDTATYWSSFGQGVILLLIQIGGMGIVTIAVFLEVVSGRKISLMQRSAMQEAISAHQVGGIVRMAKFILKTTVFVELLGLCLLLPVFRSDFGIGRSIWYALFHSVSAFCNAGFDLLGVKEPFSSLTTYAATPVMNFTIIALIVTGGIGFLTWQDIKENKWHLRKYRMQSKVILTVTGVLILFPTLYFFFFEYSELPLGERCLTALFQAVTPRTAGFNTTDFAAMSENGQMLTIVLMLIGGSPGSTAGGMKTTTIAVLLAASGAVFCKAENTYIFKRRILDDAVRHAVAVFMMYIVLFLTGGMIISHIENVSLLSALFETASAIGTVGLSLGLTPQLGIVSRLILIVLMFFGRVGGLTLIFAAINRTGNTISKYPQGKIVVG